MDDRARSIENSQVFSARVLIGNSCHSASPIRDMSRGDSQTSLRQVNATARLPEDPPGKIPAGNWPEASVS
jgi:hypothetical protein